MRERSPLFTRLRLMIARLIAGGSDLPPFGDAPDPYARVRVPRPGGRPGRYASIALAEPDEESELAGAIGGSGRR